MTPDLTCAESRNDVVLAVPFRAARIRKIIISNGADRARLKMSSPGRLVGQTFSSIIPGPAAERRFSLGFVFHLPTDRPTDRPIDRPLLSGCQNLSVDPYAMKFSPRQRYATNFTRLPSFFSSFLSSSLTI